MYKFSSDLNLKHLIGCEVVQVSHAPYNLTFSLEPNNFINIEGYWRLINANEEVVDEGNEQNQKDAYRTHQLLGQKIKECVVMNPTTLAVIFNNGWKLEIMDDSDQYESYHISPDIHI